MSYFTKKQNDIKQYWRERRYSLSALGLNPDADWRYVITAFFVLLVVVFASGFATYKDVMYASNSEATEVSNESKIVDLDEVNLILSRFNFEEESESEMSDPR